LEEGLRFITRLPATYNEHGRVIEEAVEADHWEEVGALASAPGTKNRPVATYRTSEAQVTLYDKEYRAVVVHSSAHDSRRAKRLLKEMDRSKKRAEEALKEIEKKRYFCKADAGKALEDALKCPATLHSLELGVEREEIYGRGRPKKGEERKPLKINYKITGMITEKTEAIQKQKRINGCFVLLCNLPLKNGEQGYGGKDVLTAYKDQCGVERNFGFLKDEAIVNALFLKKPSRIEALGLILLISLLIARLLEYQMRDSLAKSGETLPGWDKKPTQKPTFYMLTIKFKGLLVIKIGNQRRLARPLSAEKKAFLKALGLTESVFTKPCGTG
jgi:transposase